MLEQKTTNPDTFAYSLQEDAGNWQEAKLKVPEQQKAYTTEEKEIYKIALQDDIKDASKFRNALIQHLEGKIEKLPTYDEDVKTEQKIKSSF